MKKKLLAFALVLCMALTMLPGGAFALAGTGTSSDPYLIGTAAELKELRDGLNNGAIDSNVSIKLTADIDLGGETWTPIKSFSGNFDGNGKVVKNFKIDATASSGGFFGTIEASSSLDDIKVNNLILSDVTATVDAYRFGTLANYVKGVVANVTVKNVTVTTTNTAAWVGGMCAFMDWPWMHDCTVENLTVNASAGADLIGGFACILAKNYNHVFDNLDVKGFKVTVTDTDSSGCGVGGFVTQTQRGWEYPKVINSDISGIDITASGLVDVGGFIAWPGAHTTAENCTTQGKIDATGVTSADCFAGGFFGNLGWNADLGKQGHKVTNCTADVDIVTSVAPAGGFVGSATNSNNNSMYAEFINCTAKGDVTSTGTAPVGGFAGEADRGVYTNCTATGTVSGQSYAGGFIGHVLDTKIKYDSRYPAGLRGYLADKITLDGTQGSYYVTGEEGKTGGLIGYVEDTLDDGNDITLRNNNYYLDPIFNPVAPASVDADESNTLSEVPPAPTPAAPASKDYTITYNGGNSFSTNKSAVPTSVEIDGQEVGFVGDGRNFTVNCIPADASRITVRWNSTSITVNFKPDATVQCTEVEIPKTGDMPLWAAVAQLFGF